MLGNTVVVINVIAEWWQLLMLLLLSKVWKEGERMEAWPVCQVPGAQHNTFPQAESLSHRPCLVHPYTTPEL